MVDWLPNINCLLQGHRYRNCGDYEVNGNNPSKICERCGNVIYKQ
jgi:hypothetical protein